MGVPFLQHPNGHRVYHCKNCNAPVVSKSHIRSKDFRGELGEACLADSAVNLVLGERVKREMSTGEHWVRPASCKRCNEGLGWYYEYAYTQEQTYKEGKWLLEFARLEFRKSSSKFASPSSSSSAASSSASVAANVTAAANAETPEITTGTTSNSSNHHNSTLEATLAAMAVLAEAAITAAAAATGNTAAH